MGYGENNKRKVLIDNYFLLFLSDQVDLKILPTKTISGLFTFLFMYLFRT